MNRTDDFPSDDSSERSVSPLQRGILWFTLLTMVLQPMAASAQVIAAAAGASPIVTAAQNGMPVVLINAPNAAGVSHNQYQKFDVETRGVILNNAVGIAQTQLAGWIEANPNLGGSAARIILNEVVSGLPTQLRGYTEVAGSRAEVVIANPSGITCNGCGFLNTSRAALVTGTPVFGGSGSLDAFRVVGGNILIEGAGLVSSTTDQIDLLARAVQANSEIWANRLNVVAGANQVAYADLSTSAIAGSGTAPAVSIDVAALGGMYANKIRLVSTEAGVGVVSAGNLAGLGSDIEISSAGRIVLAGRTQAGGNLVLEAASDIQQSGTAYAGGNVAATAANIDNTGTIAALGNIVLTAGDIASSGTLAAGVDATGLATGSGNLQATASNDLTLGGTVVAGGNLAFSANNIDLRNIDLRGGGDFDLDATQRIDTRGANVIIGGNLTLAAAVLDNRLGLIQTVGDLGITTGSTDNTGGQLLAGRDLNHVLTDAAATSVVGIQAAGRHAIVSAAGNLQLGSNDEISGGDMVGVGAEQLDNAGRIVGNDVAIVAGNFNNTGASAFVGALNDLAIRADNTVNDGGASLYAARDFDLRGRNGGQAVSLANRSSLIEAGRDLIADAALIDNARTNMVITTTVLNQFSLYYIAYGDIWPSAPYSGNNVYLMYSPQTAYERERGVDVSVTRDSVADPGTPAQMQAGRNATFGAVNLNNIGSIIAAGGALTTNVSGTLNNTGVSLYESEIIYTHHLNCVDYRGGCRGGRSDVYTTDRRDTLVDGIASTLQGATSVSVVTGSLNQNNANPRNIVAPGSTGNLPSLPGSGGGSGGAAINLPTGGLYSTNTAPNAQYLIETDPRFASRANFLSSDYFLQQLGLDYNALGKRAGDGFVEANLVRDQLFQLTGRRFLTGYADENAQLLALYDAGARAATTLNLTPGVALTPAQTAALTSDMLWMQKETVTLADGRQFEVLVPKLYLAQVRDNDLSPKGALIAGGTVDLYAANDITLRGTVDAQSDLRVSASDILLRAGKLQGLTIDLQASNNLAMQGGSITGQDVRLAAGNDLSVERMATGETVRGSVTQLLEDAPRITSRNDAVLVAGNDLSTKGAEIATGGNLTLAAGNNLEIGASTRGEDWNAAGGDASYRRSAVFSQGSLLKSGGDTQLIAGVDLGIFGSKVDSGGQLAVAAGRDIAIGAAYDVVDLHYAGGSSNEKKGAYASGDSHNERATGSQLLASNNLTVAAGQAGSGNLVTQGATLRAGADVALSGTAIQIGAATENSYEQSSYRQAGKAGMQQNSRQMEESKALGSIVDAGGKLSIASSGDTAVIGSALASGGDLSLQVGGNLALLAAESRRSETINAFLQGRKKATTLEYSAQEVRQLLTSITVGGNADIAVGGDLSATVGTRNPDGSLQADVMTANGVVQGDGRQQVSVKRTGVGASDNPTDSQVLGNLAAQGIRNHSNDSFNASEVLSGQPALQSLLSSGLLTLKNDPSYGQLQKTLQNDGSTLTYKDDSGRVSLTVAGQAKVQEVFNTLKVSETFDTKKFADAQTAQIVTLVAAVVLTVMTGGAGSGTIGAALAGSGASAATIASINAAVIAMSSTMLGQMAGGASFGDAFQAGLKSGASAALTAGILNAQVFDTAQGMQSLNQLANVQSAGANIVGTFNADTFGQNLLGMVGRGVVNAGINQVIYGKEGGSFQNAFFSSMVADLAAVGANAVGQGARPLTWQNILGHAAVGGIAAKLTGKDAVAGAIGGAGAAIINPLLDQAIGGADGSGWGSNLESAQKMQSAVLQLASMGITGAVASATGHDGLTAAGAAQNETVNNYLANWQKNKRDEDVAGCKGSSWCERGVKLKWFARSVGQDAALVSGMGLGAVLEAKDLITSLPEIPGAISAIVSNPELLKNLPGSYAQNLVDTYQRFTDALESAGADGATAAGVYYIQLVNQIGAAVAAGAGVVKISGAVVKAVDRVSLTVGAKGGEAHVVESTVGGAGRVQTRINVANGPTETTPLRNSGSPVSAGFDHVVDGHFDVPVTNSRSVFSISPTELKELLQSKTVVSSPVTALGDDQFVRTVDVGKIIGTTTLTEGGVPTSFIKIFTDRAGNLITTFPVKGGK